jgi:CRISPR/Cas system-associated exonuclease Cas4 (RecB family)
MFKKLELVQTIDFKSLFLNKVEKKLMEPREGAHVSDTVLCPRKGVFHRLNPDEKPNPKMKNWTLCGKQVHAAAQDILGMEEFEIEKKISTTTGIVGSVDIYIKAENKPVEYKTTRSARKNLPKSFHIEQLKRYMAILNSPDGVLFYQLINDFSDDPFLQFDIHITEEEKREVLKNMEYDRIEWEEAIKNKDPSIARAIMGSTSLGWLCEDCPFRTQCEKIYSKD